MKKLLASLLLILTGSVLACTSDTQNAGSSSRTPLNGTWSVNSVERETPTSPPAAEPACPADYSPPDVGVPGESLLVFRTDLTALIIEDGIVDSGATWSTSENGDTRVLTLTPDDGIAEPENFKYEFTNTLVSVLSLACFASDSDEIITTTYVLTPLLNNPGAQTNAENDTVSLQITAVTPYDGTVRYTAVRLPPGLILNESTGLISGTIELDSAPAYNTEVSVTDRVISRTATFIWTVTPATRAIAR